MKLFRYLRSLRKSFSKYRPLVEVFIYSKNVVHNLNEYKSKYPSVRFAPVIKSNAYGHGLSVIASILEKEDVPFVCVDSLYEAIVIRELGLKKPLLVIGYTTAENIVGVNLSNVAVTLTSLEQLKEVDSLIFENKKFQLKIDTGMHRQGILESQISEAVEIIKKNKFIELEGICSHFSDADGWSKDFSEMQIRLWGKCVKIFKNNFPNLKYYHLANTAGSFYAEETVANVARLGIGLYGVNPSPFSHLDLKPVMEMKSVLGSVKTIAAGEFVGYNNTYAAKKEMKVATVPGGYFEGIDRRLSNVGFFGIAGRNCPIIGRVSMNITTVDVSSVENAKIGDPVVVISKNRTDPSSVENIAKLANTIPYEIFVHVPGHLRRTLVE